MQKLETDKSDDAAHATSQLSDEAKVPNAKSIPAEPKYDSGSSFGFSRIGTAAKAPKESLKEKLKQQQISKQAESGTQSAEVKQNKPKTSRSHSQDTDLDKNAKEKLSTDAVSFAS